MISVYRKGDKFSFIQSDGFTPFALIVCTRIHEIDATRDILIIPGVCGADSEFRATAALLSAKSGYFGLSFPGKTPAAVIAETTPTDPKPKKSKRK